MKIYGLEVSKKKIMKIVIKKLPSEFYKLILGTSFKKVFWVIVFLFLGIIIILHILDTNFDKIFWISFLESLLSNVAIFFIAIFLIDYLFKKEDIERLREINKHNSDFIVFEINRITFLILKFLGLASDKDIGSHTDDIDFNWTSKELKGYLDSGEIEKLFFKQYLESKDPENFVAEFIKLVTKFAEGLGKSIEKIYPHANAEIQTMNNDFFKLAGHLSLLGTLPTGFKKEMDKQGKKLKSEQFETISRLVYFSFHPLLKILRNLIEIRKMALKNKIFLE